MFDITLTNDINVLIKNKFEKFIDRKAKDFSKFVNQDGNILDKSSIEDYYKTVSSNPNIHKLQFESYYDLLLNVTAILDKSNFIKNKKFKNCIITPYIVTHNNVQHIEGIYLTIPKDTKFKITYIKIGNILTSKCGVKIKITDCPLKALKGITLNLPTSFMDHFKLEQI